MGSDLLGKFSGKKLPPVEKTEEVELNLGLSLGGCFGGKPKEGGGLYRSSSTTLWRDGGGGGSDLSLMRTSSLPSGCLEETRKRKGLMDVIKMEMMKKELEERRKKFCGATAAMGLKGSSGSGGSGGSGSSGVTELERQPAQAQVLTNPNATGQKNHAESSSPTSVLSSPEQPNAYNGCPRPIKKVDIKTEPKTDIRKGKSKTSCTSGLNPNPNPNPSPTDEMPHVFTKGDGPNGKRVEGFLFKYKKGEEVRIVCVCHGSFLTPAEFVKHAGGNEVAHPLRRILVVPSPSFFL